jgi:hypothetical protein
MRSHSATGPQNGSVAELFRARKDNFKEIVNRTPDGLE